MTAIKAFTLFTNANMYFKRVMAFSGKGHSEFYT